MAIKTLGPLSFNNDVRAEFSGPDNLSGYYRGGSYVPNYSVNNNVPTSGTLRFSNFYGAEGAFTLNFTTNQTNNFAKSTPDYTDVNLKSALLAAGWNPAAVLDVHRVRVNINADVIITGSNTTTPAFTIPSDITPTNGAPMILTINNYGYIMGRGGQGGRGRDANSAVGGTTGEAGGPGILIQGRQSNVTINFNNYGQIGSGGGGGGGGGSWHDGTGGGGAGGRPYGRAARTDRTPQSVMDAMWFLTAINNTGYSWMETGWQVQDGFFFPVPGAISSYFHDYWADIPVNQRAPAGQQYGTEQYPFPRVFNMHASALTRGVTFPEPTANRGLSYWMPFNYAPYQGGNGGDLGASGSSGVMGTDNSPPTAGGAAGAYAINGNSYINNFQNTGSVLGVVA